MEIRISEEIYRELVEVQVEEFETGQHLCEEKLAVLADNNVEAEGGLGFLLANYEDGSDRSHNTTLGYGDDSYKWNSLTISFFDDEDEQVFEDVRIVLEDGEFFSAKLEDTESAERYEVVEV